jgi:NADPH:quinone reductase
VYEPDNEYVARSVAFLEDGLEAGEGASPGTLAGARQRAHTKREHPVGRASTTTSHQDIHGLSREASPPPGPDEILVRVEACGLDHVEHELSAGATSQLPADAGPSVCGMDAAGTVIAAGDRVTRFAVGDEVFGHFPAESWTWIQGPCARTAADGPHVERRPEGLDPLAAVALADYGLSAKTLLRAAEPQPGRTALVIGATSSVGPVLVPLLAEAGAHVIAAVTPEDDDYVRSLGAADTIEYTTASPVTDVLAAHPDVDLFVDLVSLGEPYFITAGATHGTVVSAVPGDEPGIPRIGISAEPGDLAALAQLADRLPARNGLPGTVPARLGEGVEEPAGQPRPRRAASTRPGGLVGAAGRINRNLVRIMRARSLNVL